MKKGLLFLMLLATFAACTKKETTDESVDTQDEYSYEESSDVESVD
jgi:hypothetical protein